MWAKRLPVLCGLESQFRARRPDGSAALLESLPEPGGTGIVANVCQRLSNETKWPGDIAPQRGDVSSLRESRPHLSIAQAHELALRQIDAGISSKPGMAAAFWDEVKGSTAPTDPEITVFYCFLSVRGATCALLEFITGQTLKQLCSQADPSACERVIPLFCRMLDACDTAALDGQNASKPRGMNKDGGASPQVCTFGVARATAAASCKLHGTIMVQPDGSWSDEILSDERGRSSAYPLLVAVYQELIGELPRGTPLAPAQITSFANRLLTPPAKPRVAKRVLPYFVSVMAGALLITSLFGLGHVLATRFQSRLAGGPLAPSVTAKPAPSIEVTPLPESVSQIQTAAPDATLQSQTRVVSEGPTSGPRLILPINPEYPKEAWQRGISGVVKLEITIAETGFVRRARRLSGNPALARSAIDAVKKWVYEPALVNGKPSLVITEVEFRFDRN